ncbi:MAG: autotransporter-associated beta strand repeat-containing protein, partial [Phycisphaerae bacterium]
MNRQNLRSGGNGLGTSHNALGKNVQKAGRAVARRRLAWAMAVGLAAPLSALGADVYWDLNGATAGSGATPTGVWSTLPADTNWTADATGLTGVVNPWVDGDDAWFTAGSVGVDAATGAYSVTLGSNVAANSIKVTAGTLTLDPGAFGITLGAGGITASSATAATINAPLTLGAAQAWNSNGGGLTVNGAVANGGNLLTIGGTGAVTFGTGAIISGNGGLTINGSGTAGTTLIFMSAPNTYTGDTTLSGTSTVVIADAGAGAANAPTSGSFGTGKVILNGASIRGGGAAGTKNVYNLVDLAADTSFLASTYNLQFHGDVTMIGNRTLDVQSTSTVTFSGAIGGSGSLTKTGTGPLTLSGANTFGGAGQSLTLTGGTLNLNSVTAVGNAANKLVIAGGTINNTSAGAITLGDNHAVTLDGDFTWGGTQALNLGTGAVSLGTTAGATRTVTANGTTAALTIGGVIADGTDGTTPAINLTKAGAGTVELAGAAGNTYTGLTSVLRGTLLLSKASGNAIGAGGLSIDSTAGAALVQLTQANQIADGAAVSLNAVSPNNARLDLNGFQETLGAITLSANTTGAAVISTGATGKLILGADLTLNNNRNSGSNTAREILITGTGSYATAAPGTGTLDLNGNRTITVNAIGTAASQDATIETNVIGVGSKLTKDGDKALRLGGAGTWDGGTLIKNGTLRMLVANAVPDSSAVEINASAGKTAVLDLNALTFTAGALTLGGASTTSQPQITTGAGTLTLGANLTYDATNNPLGATVTGTGGKLDLGASTRTFTIGDSATSNLDTSVAVVVLGGAGVNIIKQGAGVLSFSSANTFAGDITVNAGQISTGGTSTVTAGAIATAPLGKGLITLAGGGMRAEGARTVHNSVLITADAVFGGTGAGNLVIDPTTVTTPAAGSITIDGARTLTVTTGSLTLTGLVTGTGSPSIVKEGAQDLIFINNSGTASTFGNVTINAGRVFVGGSSAANSQNAMGAGAYAVGASGTLAFQTTGMTTGNAITLANGGNISARVATTLTNVTLPSAGTVVFNDDDNTGSTLTINSAFPTLTGDLTVQLGGTRSLANAVGTVNLVAPINDGAGTNSLTLNGSLTGTGTAGTLILTADNTYDGGTFVNKGTLQANGTAGAVSGALGTGGVTLAAGTVLNLKNNSTASNTTVTYGNNVTLNGSATIGTDRATGGTFSGVTLGLGSLTFGADNLTLTTTLGNTYGLAFSGAVTMGATGSSFTNAGALALNGVVSGGALTKAGAGALTLANANLYTGQTTINTGTVVATNVGSLGTNGVGANTVVGTGGALDVRALLVNEPISIIGTGVSNGGALNTGSSSTSGAFTGSIAATAPVTMTGAASVGALATSTLTINSVIDDGGSNFALTKLGAGTVSLTGTNTYGGGTVINAGVLNVATDAALGDVPVTPTTNITFGGTTGTLQLGSTFNFNANRLISIGSTFTGTVDTNTFDSVLSTGVVGGAGNFAKTGVGILTLTGTAVTPNTYLGTTTVNGGTLKLAGGNAIPDTSAVVVTSGILDVNGTSESIPSISGATAGEVALSSNAVLTLTNQAAGNLTSLISGNGSLIKNGAGTLTLNRTTGNTFAGGLTINSGAVTISSNTTGDNLGTGTVTLAGGQLNVRYDTTNTGQTNNAFAVTASSTIDYNRSGTTATNQTVTLPSLTFSNNPTLTLNSGNGYILAVSGATTLNSNATVTITNATGTVFFSNAADPVALGANTLTVNANSAVNLQIGPATANDVVNRVTGAGGIIVNSTSTGGLAIFGSNTFAGGVTHNSGILIVGTSSNGTAGDVSFTQGGLGTGTLTLNGGTIRATGNGDRVVNNALTIGGDVNYLVAATNTALTFNGATSLTGSRVMNVAFTTGGPKAVTINGTITESAPGFSITKTGDGPLVLNGNNNFSGGAIVKAGTLTTGNAGGLGLNSVPVLVGDTTGPANATLTIGAAGLTVVNPITIRSGTDAAAVIGIGGTNATGTTTFSNTITAQRDFAVSQSTAGATTVIGGLISDTSVVGGINLTKSGAGIVQLTNALNTFGGTGKTITITGGLLSFSDNAQLGNVNNALIFNGGGIQTTTTMAQARPITMTGAGAFDVAAGTTFTVNSGFGAGSGTLTKSGTGTLEFTPAVTNVRTGSTTVSGGTVRLTGATSLSTAGAVSVTGASTLDLLNDVGTNYGHNLTLTAGLTINVDRAAGGAGVNQTHTLGTLTSNNQTLTVTGANGYGLALGAVSASDTFAINSAVPLTLASLAETNAATKTITFGGAGTTTINGAVTQNAAIALGLTQNNAASGLILNGTTNRTGTTTISAGFVQPATTTALGTGGISIGATGVLRYRTDVDSAFANNVTVTASGATINVDQATVAGTNRTIGFGTLGIGVHTLNLTSANGYGVTFGAVSASDAAVLNNASTGLLTVASVNQSNTGAKSVTFTGTGDALVTGGLSATTAANLLLTKTGAGTLTLNGAGTHSGATTLNGGTLKVNNTTGSATGTGAFTFTSGTLTSSTDGTIAGLVTASAANNTTIAPGGLASIGALTLGGGLTTTNRTTLNFDLTTPGGSNDLLTIGGTFTIGGGTGLAFPVLPTVNGTYLLMNTTATAVGNFAVPTAPVGKAYTLTGTGTAINLVVGDAVLNNAWNLNVGGTWNDTASWSAGSIPNGTGQFAILAAGGAGGITAPATVTLDGSKTVGALTFNNASFGYTVAAGSGGPLVLDNGSTTGATVTVTAGTHTISAPVNLHAATPTFDVATGSELIVTGVIAPNVVGNGLGFVKTGAGTLSLSAGNTFTGPVVINGGAVAVVGQGSVDPTTFGAGAKTITLNNGGTLRVTSGNFDPGSSTKAVVIGATGGTIEMVGTATGALNDGSQFSGTGTLTKTGTGTLTIGQATVGYTGFTGNVDVQAGKLTLANTTAIGNTPGQAVTVASGAVVDVQQPNLTQNFSIVGTGLASAPAGALQNSASTAGGIAGTVTLTGDSHIGVAGTGSLTLANTISGPFNLTKVGTGAGALILAGNNTFGGATKSLTIAGGTVQISADNNLGDANNSVVFNGSSTTVVAALVTSADLTLNRPLTLGGINPGIGATAGATLTYAGTATGTAGLSKVGAGTLIFSNPVGYTGQTNVNAGTLSLLATDTLPATAAVRIGSASTTVGTLNVAADTTLGELTVVSNDAVNDNVLAIAAGKTLTVNGRVIVGQSGGFSTTRLATTGGGNLTVNHTAPAGVFLVGGNTGTTTGNGNNARADLSGLANFELNLNTTDGILRVNNPSSLNTSGALATLILANTSNALTGKTLAVGDSQQNNTGGTQVNTLSLGAGTNTLKFDAVNIGTGGRDLGRINFASPTGSVTVRATDGVARAAFNMASVGGSTGVNGEGNTFDVAGHTADLLLDAVLIGQQNRGMPSKNTFAFNQGTLDMTSLNMSRRSANAGTGVGPFTTDSTMTLGGGTVTVQNEITMATLSGATVADTKVAALLDITGGNVTVKTAGATAITLATSTITAAGNEAKGTLRITGTANVEVQGDVIKGASTGNALAILELDGGTLDMTGKRIGGSAAANNLTTVTLASGTIKNVGGFNNGAPFVKTTAGTLIVDGTNTYAGPTTVSAGTLRVNSSLPNTSAVTVAAGNAKFIAGA